MQCLSYAVHDVAERRQLHGGRLPLSAGASLSWLSFTEEGLLAALDSEVGRQGAGRRVTGDGLAGRGRSCMHGSSGWPSERSGCWLLPTSRWAVGRCACCNVTSEGKAGWLASAAPTSSHLPLQL